MENYFDLIVSTNDLFEGLKRFVKIEFKLILKETCLIDLKMVGSTRTYFYMVVFAIAVSVAVADKIKINDAPEEVNLDTFQEEMEDQEEQFRHRT